MKLALSKLASFLASSLVIPTVGGEMHLQEKAHPGVLDGDMFQR